MSKLSVAADRSESQAASQWLDEAATHARIPAEHIARLDHCLDEALANILMHGGRNALAAPIELQLEVSANKAGCEAILTISDSGIAFNPLAAVPKSRPKTLAEAEPGGLGILLMRSNADRLSYCYKDGRNHLSLVVNWQTAAS